MDGAELKTISEKDYRKSVLYVEQTPYLFSADLQNNITLFEDPQEPELNQLLDLLELKNLNHDLTKLSGGQKQRVHLARALYQGQQVLILDEATSSLNSELQYKIEKELFSQEDLTIVIITHHLDARIAELADEVVNF
ncbi:ATP-binding cassette domain-containing protein [Enterococcus timonensis]|uniref:ATP-binding cassette domain-containing protein n=1 Tax=Enterococcus timonensis TaxID=1852364 RepID=UPI0008D97EF6|nr:ATP-binding cassette domain-containing protein [Enterococcus timonensis]